jgi:hypothetical protein
LRQCSTDDIGIVASGGIAKACDCPKLRDRGEILFLVITKEKVDGYQGSTNTMKFDDESKAG